MTTRARLLEAHTELTAAIRGAETWEKSYTDSPSTFKRLVREEARLRAAANGYLLGLNDRIPTMINWAEVPPRLLLASVIPPADDDLWKRERELLSLAVIEHILELMVIGANAGEELYSRPLGITTLDEAILNAAGKYTAELVSGVTSTTRRQIRKAIESSIRLGEDSEAMVARIRKRVANPVRAEMIAQTESVNAYQTGLDHFAAETGALSSTWDALSGACQLCAPMDGKTVRIGKSFKLPNGNEVLRPPAHTRCRCGRIINYPK